MVHLKYLIECSVYNKTDFPIDRIAKLRNLYNIFIVFFFSLFRTFYFLYEHEPCSMKHAVLERNLSTSFSNLYSNRYFDNELYILGIGLCLGNRSERFKTNGFIRKTRDPIVI